MKMSKVMHLVPWESLFHSSSLYSLCLSSSITWTLLESTKSREAAKEKVLLAGGILWSYVEEVAFRLGQVRKYDKQEQNLIL